MSHFLTPFTFLLPLPPRGSRVSLFLRHSHACPPPGASPECSGRRGQPPLQPLPDRKTIRTSRNDTFTRVRRSPSIKQGGRCKRLSQMRQLRSLAPSRMAALGQKGHNQCLRTRWYYVSSAAWQDAQRQYVDIAQRPQQRHAPHAVAAIAVIAVMAAVMARPGFSHLPTRAWERVLIRVRNH